MATPRKVLVERITKETKVQVSLSLDGGPLDLLPNNDKFPAPIPSQETEHHATQHSTSQQIWVWTGVGFFDHMLHALAKHGGWSLRIRTLGDLASMRPYMPYVFEVRKLMTLQSTITTPSRIRFSAWAKRLPRLLVTRKVCDASDTHMHH
jgi:hypothetical protein